MSEGGARWRPYAAGDRIRRWARAAEDGFEILTPGEQPGWRTPSPAPAGGVSPPGTPVLFEGAFYEVVEHQPPDSARRQHLYRLRVWNPRQPMRAPVEYSQEYCERLSRALARRAAANRVARLLRLFQPAVSLLPAVIQRDLERRYDYPALRGTLLGATALAVWASVSWAMHLAAPLSGPPPELAAPRALALYLLLESTVRAISALKAQEPMGSAPLALALWIVQGTRAALSGDSRTRSHTSAGPSRSREDRVRAWPLAEAVGDGERDGERVAALEVRSSIAKDHWTLGRTAVRYGEHLYLPVEGGRDPQTETFVYLLQPLQEGQFPATVLDYTPDENHRLLAARLRRDRQTWIDSLALLWGNLDRDRQQQLAEIYDFDCRRFTSMSILVNGGLALSLVPVAAGQLAESGRLSDVMLLVIGGYFVVESALRGLRLRRGELSGGLLGWLLHPATERLVTF